MLIKHQCVLFRRNKNITEKQSCANTAVLYNTAAAPLRHTIARQTEGYDVRIEWLQSKCQITRAPYVIEVQTCSAVKDNALSNGSYKTLGRFWENHFFNKYASASTCSASNTGSSMSAQ